MKTGNISLAPLSPTFLKTLLNSNWDFPSIPSPLSRHHHTKLRFPQAEIWGNTQIFKYNFLATLKILLIEINMAEGRRRIRRTLLRRQRAPSPPPPPKKKKVNDRLNPLEIYTDDYLHFENFRFRRPTIHYLLGLLTYKYKTSPASSFTTFGFSSFFFATGTFRLDISFLKRIITTHKIQLI